MTRHPRITAFAALILLAAFAFFGRNKIHFDFGLFRSQLARADWRRIALAGGCIYAGILVRSIRWAWLLRRNRKPPLIPLLSAQMIGFAAVALFGRVADLTRPYLTAKKTGLPVSIQIAVYVIERLFDAAMLALLFSSAIYIAHFQSEILRRAAIAAFLGTVIGAVFLAALRLAGDAVPSFFARVFARFSRKLGRAAGEKLRTFRAGLSAMRSFSDLALVAFFSACLWGLIAAAYYETTRAFIADRQLATMSFARCIPLLAVSSGASFLQLPVLGWFSQIALVAAGMSAIYGVPAEVSTAWSATLLLVTFLSPIPAGLIWAQAEGISLRQVTEESGHARESR